MSTAPSPGTRTGHYWLIVGTASSATPGVDATPNPAEPWQPWLSTATAALGTLRDRCAGIVHGVRAASTETAAALRRAMHERSVPISLSALGPLTRRIGNRLRPRRDWWKV